MKKPEFRSLFSHQFAIFGSNVTAREKLCPRRWKWLFGNQRKQIAMVGDSLKFGSDGPKLKGMLGFHLGRSGRGAGRHPVQFTQLAIESRIRRKRERNLGRQVLQGKRSRQLRSSPTTEKTVGFLPSGLRDKYLDN
jgi:hypothetical protein